MKTIKEDHLGISTYLALSLIPMSGLATDVYIPSLPSMATQLQVSSSAVQLSIVVFMISYGACQLFVGSLLDSFGRYWLGITSLAVFALASFVIANTRDMYVFYAMRVLHGITVALIVVGKRAFFVDVYSGEKLKHYTSIFAIVYSSSPIIAPFLGGYLQAAFGWQSNFYLLGSYAFLIMVLDLLFGGETLKHAHPFELKPIVNVYSMMLKAPDFVWGLVLLGFGYTLLVVFGMSSPFIIEHVFHLSPVATGYAALVSGLSIFAGALVSKLLLRHHLTRKMTWVIFIQIASVLLLVALSSWKSNLFTLLPLIFIIHGAAGFMFSNVFVYCMVRFTKNAGMASGITGGGILIISSTFSYTIVNAVVIKNQLVLSVIDLGLVAMVAVSFLLFRRSHHRESKAAEAILQVKQG